jgi:hypothetical protein
MIQCNSINIGHGNSPSIAIGARDDCTLVRFLTNRDTDCLSHFRIGCTADAEAVIVCALHRIKLSVAAFVNAIARNLSDGDDRCSCVNFDEL